MMQDSGREIGYVAVDVKDDAVRILELELFDRTDDRLSVDSLMRAAASYGEAAGARRIKSQIGGFEEIFRSAGFQREGDNFLCDLSKLIKNKCRSHSNP